MMVWPKATKCSKNVVSTASDGWALLNASPDVPVQIERYLSDPYQNPLIAGLERAADKCRSRPCDAPFANEGE